MTRAIPAVALGLGLTVACAAAGAAAAQEVAHEGGKVRTYFIAADEVLWDFAPTRTNQVTGERYHFEADPASRGTRDPNTTAYRKTVYREYTDSTFRTLKARTADWAHLGIFGPLIRAEVGDTIRVVFRNHASRPYSVHPHGVLYSKANEGTAYQDGTSGPAKADDAVAPGATYTYVWQVSERAGPAEGDGSTAFWVYHSHVDEGRDINTGLIGPLIITRRGMARADGSPRDVDREFVALFALFDEHRSWQWDENLRLLYGDPSRYDDADPRVHEFHHFFTINGYLDGNGPMMTMTRGESVRWYLLAGTNEEESWDIHTAHWHGQTATIAHMRTDMVMLNPMMSAVADMVPDAAGTWLLHCHMPGHFEAGMRTRFTVLP
jgi:FtsP/CotA-like multicopper oxidase with cupredoxin domain